MFHVKHSPHSAAVLEYLRTIDPSRDWGPAIASLDRYADLLLQHAARRNLLSASQRNPESVWEHIFDSLQPLALPQFAQRNRFLDAGSGGGLPGIPLAIVLPDARFRLVDRSGSKSEFLELAKALIPLANVETRSEELKSELQQHGAESTVLARALAQPSSWGLIFTPSASNPTWIVFATSGNQSEWTRAASAVKLEVTASHAYTLPISAAARVLLQFS